MSGLALAERELSDAEFEQLRRFVDRYAGIELSNTKRDLLYNRLSKRLRALNLRTFSQYCKLLESDGGEEIEQFVNAVTTNLTSFFREPHHFEFLRESVLAPLTIPGARPRFRIWSAGCSTGEEPYSIAMTVAERIPGWENRDLRVLATDIDSDVLGTGRAGIYRASGVKGVNELQRERWFQPTGKGNVQVHEALRRMIAFRHLNLMEPWPMNGKFNAIFCRNVVIYFSKDRQRELFDRFADALTDDGYLFVGHSESLFQVCDRFRLIGRSIYQRVN